MTTVDEMAAEIAYLKGKREWLLLVSNRLKRERDEATALLKQAQPEYCSMKCPSVFTDASSPRHTPECDAMRLYLEREASR